LPPRWTTLGPTVIREVCDPAVTAIYRLAVAEAERSPEAAETLNAKRSVNRGAEPICWPRAGARESWVSVTRSK